jgi:iron complex outermembrane receptor protein
MMPPTTLHFAGSTDIDLMTSDMVEIGFRSRLFGNILLDLEVFGAKSRDFISLNADHSWVDLAGEPTPTGLPESFSRISFMDSPLESTQIGGSLNMDWIISEKLIFRGHANLQQTMLDNYFPYSKLKVLNMQLTKLFSTAALLGAGELSPQDDLSPAYLREDGKLETRFTPDELQDDIKHKATPQFWGMVGLIYRPFKQWQLSTNGYYTSNQTFINQNTTVDIEPKLVLSGKASFKPSEKIEVFIHGHNILNNTSTEFAFMDPVGEIYMMGLKFKY